MVIMTKMTSRIITLKRLFSREMKLIEITPKSKSNPMVFSGLRKDVLFVLYA